MSTSPQPEAPARIAVVRDLPRGPRAAGRDVASPEPRRDAGAVRPRILRVQVVAWPTPPAKRAA